MRHLLCKSGALSPKGSSRAARWARRVSGLFRRRGPSAYTLALAVGGVEGLFVTQRTRTTGGVETGEGAGGGWVCVCLEGVAIEQGGSQGEGEEKMEEEGMRRLRTGAAQLDEATGAASFGSEAEPLVARVAAGRPAPTLAVRMAGSGALLAAARLDVGALASHGAARRLRLPLHLPTHATWQPSDAFAPAHAPVLTSDRAELVVLALAVPAPEPRAETCWDADTPRPPRDASDASAPTAPGRVEPRAWRRSRRNSSHDSHGSVGSTSPSASYGRGRCEESVDAFSDADDLSLDDLSSLFQKVDTAQPWPAPTDHPPRPPVKDRLAALWHDFTFNDDHLINDFYDCDRNDDDDEDDDDEDDDDENVITRGPIEYI